MDGFRGFLLAHNVTSWQKVTLCEWNILLDLKAMDCYYYHENLKINFNISW